MLVLDKVDVRAKENIKDRTEDNLETAENIVKLEEKLRNLQIEAANINAQLGLLDGSDGSDFSAGTQTAYIVIILVPLVG